MDTFDMEQWKNDYDRYKYNKDYLGFDLSLKMKEGKAKIKTNALPAVKKDLIPLLEAIINQGNLYALISLSYEGIEKTDYQHYQQSWIQYYTSHMEAFLQILIYQGIDSFLDLISKTQTMHSMAYHLNHTWPEVDESSNLIWKGKDGYQLDSDSYWTKDSEYGTIIRPDSYIAWEKLLMHPNT